MAMSSVTALPAAPVDEAHRIQTLDVLRGFAVLGILLLNIWSFALPQFAYSKPNAMGELTGADYWAWFFTYLLGDYKFVTLFSLLFGAGVMLMTGRAEAAGRDAGALHRRRMFWLGVIGALHGYLIWHGDILFIYAVCGFVIFFIRDWPVRHLYLAGLLLIAGGSAIAAAQSGFIASWSDQRLDEFIAAAGGSPETFRDEIENFRSGWLTQMRERVPLALRIELSVIGTEAGPRTVGVMVLGMALMRSGFLAGQAPAAIYAALSLAGFALGLPLVYSGIAAGEARGWDVYALYGLSHQFNYWGSLFVAAGWMGLVLMICRAGRLQAVQRRLGAVGRMALTNYLMQSVLATLIFYGHGLGMFARLGRAELLLVVLGIWAVQLVWSEPWLRYFRFGPVEWLWRGLTYERVQPFRRRQKARPAPGPPL
ncbi:MAG: DUF418 domain-containing protein [Alphaproteobacteria bacterium]